MPLTYNVKVWRQMADRARGMADRLGNPTLKARITSMAVGFDAMADRLDRLLAKHAARPDQPFQEDEQRSPNATARHEGDRSSGSR